MTYREDMATPTETEEREIGAILENFESCGIQAVYSLIDGQLAALHARAQGLTQLSGVVITVTGFSGRIIADTNVTAQVFIIVGICLVLAAAAICLFYVMPVRWVSSYLDLPKKKWLLVAIRRRNKKTRAFFAASMILIFGLLFYIASISIMLANPEATELTKVR